MSARPVSRDAQPAAVATLEAMREGDLDAVMQIEQLSFRLPWSRQVFMEELSRPWAFLDVVRAGGGSRRVLAFCNYWRVADEVHILKVATHPDARRFGFGSRLLSHIVDFARAGSCKLARRFRRGVEGYWRCNRGRIVMSGSAFSRWCPRSSLQHPAHWAAESRGCRSATSH
jgi:GNAT superfamily N-acetyltransferase